MQFFPQNHIKIKEIRYLHARFIGSLGAIKNLTLASLKIIFGIFGHSHALLADGVHSLADLLIDCIVIIAAKFGSKAADENHPYGHGRIETAATVFLALILAIAGFSIILEAGFTLASHIKVLPSAYVLWIAILSIIFNEILFLWTKKIATQVKSQLLIAQAWHHRSDSVASLAVAIGMIGVWLGFDKLDALAAIVVGSMILKIAWNFGWKSMQELVDTALDMEETEKISQFILNIPGVTAVHQLRTRSIAGAILCDVHVLVDPNLSVSEGHYIGKEVEHRLMTQFSGIKDVIVHIDTEDDKITHLSHLPNRANLQPLLKKAWGKLVPEFVINSAALHYQNDKIIIELKLPLRFSTQTNLLQDMKKIMESEKSITDIKLFYYQAYE
jgi:cation diffusion facilitator family transporter